MSTEQEQRQQLSTREAADLAGVNVSYIRRLVADGRLKGYKVGDRWIVDRADLLRWMAERED